MTQPGAVQLIQNIDAADIADNGGPRPGGAEKVSISGLTTASVDSTGATIGEVLTADGAGGTSWEIPTNAVAANAAEAASDTVNNKYIAPATLPLWRQANDAVQASLTGNARGAEAIDLQQTRGAVTQVASGASSFVVGINNSAIGANSCAEGAGNAANSYASHAEGTSTTASNNSAHAEGTSTTASGDSSHAEGNTTSASADSAHSEGGNTTASGGYSHSEGRFATASGDYSHAEGLYSVARVDNSHAEGAGQEGQYACYKSTRSTANATPVAMPNPLPHVANQALSCLINIVAKKTGAAEVACYLRRCLVVSNGANFTIPVAVETIGTDVETAGMTGCDVLVSIVTNALTITVTGIAANVQWTAYIQAAEVILA